MTPVPGLKTWSPPASMLLDWPIFRHALAAKRDFAEASNGLGRWLHERERYAEAKKALEAAFEQEKNALDGQDRALAAELSQVEGLYREAAARVEKSLLVRYTQIKASRKDQPLAAVRDGI